ncbi:mitochondrial translation factor atp22 [Maudiozyma exigua]|uniref:Mitochondrial translation factor atp22 n=1 Tax=Maudiozyma exigua TaxID=34358 RepID=A0A9P6W7T6_MAUEX|nr:mitochondrial translation factor atp22 [Kazachstania exigua]
MIPSLQRHTVWTMYRTCNYYRQYSSLVDTTVPKNNIINNNLPEDFTRWLENIPLTNNSLVIQHSTEILQLNNWIEQNLSNFEQLAEIKSSLLNKFHLKTYKLIQKNLIEISNDPNYLKVLLQPYISTIQYQSFINYLEDTISQRGSKSPQEINNGLYKMIHSQSMMFKSNKPGASLVLPNSVHKWFYDNLPKSSTFQHYMFLIENNIFLSNCQHSRLFTERLLQGSELELQLVTFNYFLLRPDIYPNIEIIKQKFVTLHNFYDIYHIINLTIKRNKKETLSESSLSFYLQALLQKIVYYKDATSLTGKSNGRQLSIQFVKFVIQLLAVTTKLESTTLFKSVLQSLILFMKKNTYIDDKTFGKLLHRPMIHILQLLRAKGDQDAIFTFVANLGELSKIPKSHTYKKMIMNELILSLRYFNDPKLICQMLVSSKKYKKTSQLLNELGLWGSIFHSNCKKVPDSILTQEIENMPNLVSNSLRIDMIQNMSLSLSEIYKSLFSTKSVMMQRDEYREFLVKLYLNYIKYIENNYTSHNFWKSDTRIIKYFLSSAMSHLQDKDLAYGLLMDFYSKPFAKKMRNKGKDCPFSIVLYGHMSLTTTQVNKALELMEQNGIPLTFKICSSMVFRYLNWHEIDIARSWYNKIVYSKFPISHDGLIGVCQKYNWELPPNSVTKLLSIKEAHVGSVSNMMVENNKITEEDMDSLLLDDNTHETREGIEELMTLVKQI